MRSGVGIVVRRLRARQKEIEDAIFAGVRDAVPEPRGELDTEYVEGLRIAVVAAVEFGFTGIERGEGSSAGIPSEAVAQARLAARSGVGLDSVLRRYIAGHALLWEYVMGEADRLERAGRASGLREMSRAQAALLDRLVIGVTREHVAELQRASGSREHRLLERVRLLLAGEDRDGDVEPGVLGRDFDYDLDGEHLGVLAEGPDAARAVRELAARLDRRLLSVPCGERSVWAWLGGRQRLPPEELERVLAIGAVAPTGVVLALGEPGRGIEGWRLTHRQAQATLLVATRRSESGGVTRYGDVALLAAALADEMLARSLTEVYLAPLEDVRGGGSALLQTLHAYLGAGRSASSAAAALGVVRNTVDNRLRTVEERLGRTLHPWPAELEIALRLNALDRPVAVADSSVDCDSPR
jgi:PucR C-terminal helix-turn-helix domain/GGDEF-like domain